MPSVNLFLPPLLGGFIFISLWYPFYYRIQRLQGYKLVLIASIAGGIFLLVAHFLVVALQNISPFQEMLDGWYRLVPIPNSAQAVLGFLLGATLWWPLNLLRLFVPALRVREVKRKETLRAGDPLEITLFQHLESQKLLSVTLRSGKVYVGRVITSINPARRVESVGLSLVRSGYRDEATHKLTLNINYEATHARIQARIGEVYAQIVDDVVLESPNMDEAQMMAEVYGRAARSSEMSALAHDFDVIIMAQEIVTVSSFNPELFEAYFELDNI